jgi:glycosyltransferase involved in cell wall biosynthesis
MPTCDGEPQKLEWVEDYLRHDRILTYSLWAKNLLENQTNGKLKVFDVASPGVDTDVFKPLNVEEVRKALNIKEDVIIFGKVARNQPRKLYPELFKAFADYLLICKKNSRDDIAAKSYLYCHTSYPDVGWDLAEEIHKHKISNKVLFTYLCKNCKTAFPSFYSGNVQHCKNCQNMTATMPNTESGLSRENLAIIYNLFDVFIQLSICEGWGMPINEAKACGVPVLCVDYSAMTEQCYNGGGLPIKVQRFYQESIQQTNQLRALPNLNDLSEKMYLLATDKTLKSRLSMESRQCTEKYYNWGLISKIWESAIDSLECFKDEESWIAPPKIINPGNLTMPANLNNQQFVEWCYVNIIQEPIGNHLQQISKLVTSLNLGYQIIETPGGLQQVPVNRDIIIQQMIQYLHQKNSFEQHRYNMTAGKMSNEEIVNHVIA